MRHAGAQAAIHGKLWTRFDDGERGPGGWVVVTEPELHFGSSDRRPRRRGLAAGAAAFPPRPPWLDLAPDWVCEVLSPSTERIDRGRKLRTYAEAGVAHAWFVNPLERTLEVLRLRDGAWTIVAVHCDSDTVRIEPFEAIELELGRLWADPPPQP